MPEHEKANYITCPKGHKIFVIWSSQRQSFGFTCDECGEHSEIGISVYGPIRIVRVKPSRKERTN